MIQIGSRTMAGRPGKEVFVRFKNNMLFCPKDTTTRVRTFFTKKHHAIQPDGEGDFFIKNFKGKVDMTNHSSPLAHQEKNTHYNITQKICEQIAEAANNTIKTFSKS